MKKNLLLYILLGFLVLMNGFFVFKHFSKSDTKKHEKRNSENFLPEQLKFDKAQTKEFENLDAVHHEKVRTIIVALEISKDVLFDELETQPLDTRKIDSLTSDIADKYKSRELMTFNFFRSVAKLCNENQKEEFKAVIKHAVGGPNGPPPPPPPPPPGRMRENKPPHQKH